MAIIHSERNHGENMHKDMIWVSSRMNRLSLVLLCWAWAGLILLGDASAGFADYGPLQTTNRFPLHLMFLTSQPVQADLPPDSGIEGSLSVDYSNTFFNQSNDTWDVLMDMEMMVVDVSMIYALTSRWGLKVDLPVVSMNDGFLDVFLGNYHDAIGVGDYGRESRPSNSFGYRVSKDNQLWIEGESGDFQLADITVSVQYELFHRSTDQDVASSLLLSVKVPTGDETLGFGSGAFDLGLYWPTQWSGKPWSFYIMPGVALIGEPDTRGADVTARNSYALFVGLAYDYSERWTWLAQINYYSSPIEETGLSDLDGGAFELDVGFHYQIRSGWILEFAFAEDLTRAVPDFNLHLGLCWSLHSD